MKNFFTKTAMLLLVTICLAPALAKAQGTDTVKTHNWMHNGWNKRMAGSLDLQVEYRKNNVSQLNNYLVQNGFGTLANNSAWYNLGMTRIYNNKLITTLGIGGTGSESVTANDVKISLFRGQIQVGAGYNLSTNSAYRFYPTVGLNFQNSFLKVKDNGNINSTTDFGTELTKSSASKTLNQMTFGIELGGGFDYVIKLKSKQMDCVTVDRNIPIGIRAGYYIAASNSDWKVDGHKLLTGPDAKTNSVFVTLVVGLGYEVHKQ
jgi:hypothetical protein